MRKKTELIIWGGTGNFKILCEWLIDSYHILGFFDRDTSVQPSFMGTEYLGDWYVFQTWIRQFKPDRLPHFIVSVGLSPGNDGVRLQLQESIQSYGLTPITAVHSSSFIARNVVIGEGSVVYPNADVNVDVRIGKACIIGHNSSINHECVIEDGASIGSGVTLAGLVEVGRNAQVFTGAVVIPRIRIGENATVGAGAVVLKDVPPGAVVVGNPARILRKK